MKNYMFITLLALLLILVGCSKNELTKKEENSKKTTVSDNTTSKSQEETTTTTLKPTTTQSTTLETTTTTISTTNSTTTQMSTKKSTTQTTTTQKFIQEQTSTTKETKPPTTTTTQNTQKVYNKDVEILDSGQSKLMYDYTGKKWTKALSKQLKGVDFSSFGFDIYNPVYIKDINSTLVLANKANRFEDNFKPINLVNAKSKHSGNVNRRKLREVAANAIDKLISAAKKDGIEIQTVSCYRTISYQKGLFKRYAAKDGEKKAAMYSSRPGHSEHHTGLCADVSSPSMNYGLGTSYGNTKEGKWIAKNAHKYGFIVRYPKGKKDITGYSYEPWHIRYLGVPLATYLKETGLCYEEFIALQVGKSPEDIKIVWE